jgi:hypothetical protein
MNLRRPLLILTAAFALVAAPSAQATTNVAAPTWPIPADAPAGPPPIPDLPAAADVPPPADQIADPVTPAASCDDWYLQSSYGNRWPAASSWWEYRCTHDYLYFYYPCQFGACPAFCPECYVEIESRADYFYWDGSDPVFYGEDYLYLFYYPERVDEPGTWISAWWDAPTARWNNLGP